MKRLTGLDATFLYMETASNHMHVASMAVFDPSTVPGGYSFDKVRDLVEDRLSLLPPFRWRLVEVPFQLTHPMWIEDPDFDLDYHVRRAALPAPGGDRELSEFAAEVFGRPLDRGRPLWEMYVVEGLEGGLLGIITKTHHAAIDGVSGAEMTVNLLDLGPVPAPTPAPEHEWQPDSIPSDAELVAGALVDLARQPLAAVKALRRTAEMALNLRRRNRQPDVTPPPGPFQAPRTMFNVPITPHRRFAYTQITLDDIKDIKNAAGATVNDVVLALCSGALRHYLAARDELPDESLVAMVPVSLRTAEHEGSLGNKVAAMLVSLASGVEDPLERLHAITEATKSAKDQEESASSSALADWAEVLPPAVAARAARLLSSTAVTDRVGPMFNVTISNVPGPDFPLYSAGAKLLDLYPMGPIADGMSLNITVMSYLGTVHFGLVACRETVPDLWDLAHGIEEALRELQKAVGRPAPAPSRRRARSSATGKASPRP
jgi:diacylglycerol O-acyltransferase / wax synthase